MSQPTNTALVTSLAQLDELFILARKHSVSHLKLGEIEVVFGLTPDTPKTERTVLTEDELVIPKDLAAEEYLNLQNL